MVLMMHVSLNMPGEIKTSQTTQLTKQIVSKTHPIVMYVQRAKTTGVCLEVEPISLQGRWRCNTSDTPSGDDQARGSSR